MGQPRLASRGLETVWLPMNLLMLVWGHFLNQERGAVQ